jgi:hypothetical protein
MSGVLESLRNPLERLEVLPTTMALRTDPLTNSPEWSASVQYFKNDVVISPVDGKAYVYYGGASDVSTVRGGSDPSASADWQVLQGPGVGTEGSAAPTFADGGAGVITVTGGTLADAGSGSKWLVCFQGTTTAGAPLVAGDTVTWTVTGSGVGGDSAVWTVVPDVSATKTSWGFSAVIEAGTSVSPATSDIVLTGAYAGVAAFQAVSGAKITWIRLA